MKELNENDLKRLLEEQLEQDGKQRSHGNDDDADLYRLLFAALADEPNTPVNIDLAESVIKQIKINELKKEAVRYNMLIAFIVIAGVLSAYFSIRYISPPALNSALSFIDTYRWIAIFIILCFGIIQIADKNLVKKNLLSS